ncbi:MAG: hypothetical protein ACKOXV_06590 [Bacteroidota bacterium]|jgi:hypothetical protein
MNTETYNGYANYATWNVSMYITNDEGLYNLVKRYDTWDKCKEALIYFGITQTCDDISFNDPDLDTNELDEMLAELS